MRRPRQHVAEDISIQIFSRSIPSEWINRKIDPDYGLDGSVELVENGNVTGNEVYVQLKGTDNPKIIGDHIAFTTKVKNLRYYMQKEIPTLLVVVDINEEQCYWVFLQKYVYETLDVDKPDWIKQNTVTIHVPLKNEVSETIEELRKVAVGGSTYLISKKIDKIPNEYFGYWKDNAEAIIKLSKVSRRLDQKLFQIKFDISYRYAKEGNKDRSTGVLWNIHNSALSAGDKDICIKSAFAIINQINSYYESEHILNLLEKIKKIVDETGNSSYEIFWWGNFLETIYVKLVKDYNAYRTLHLVTSQKSESLMEPFLKIEIQKTVSEIFKVAIDFVSYMKRAYEEKEYMIFLDFLKRISKMQWLWCYNNSLGGNRKIIKEQLELIESTLSFANQLSDVLSKDYKFMVLLDLAYLYNSSEENELRDISLSEAMALAKKLEHKGYQSEILHAREFFGRSPPTIPFLLNRSTRKLPEEPKEITYKKEEEMIKYLLRIGGIDLEAGNRLAQLAR